MAEKIDETAKRKYLLRRFWQTARGFWAPGAGTRAWYLTGDEQTARRLGVGQQEHLEFVHRSSPRRMGGDPVEVSASAAADESVAGRVAGAVQIGHGGWIDARAHPASARHLVEVPEQPEASHVGRAGDAGRERRG